MQVSLEKKRGASSLKEIVAYCRKYGLIFQSSEIYDGLGGVYDYGPIGVEIKKNIKEWWWYYTIYLREDVVGLDAAILMHPAVWEASGHTSLFLDVFIDDKECKARFRADDLIEDYIKKNFPKEDPQAHSYLSRLSKAVNEKNEEEITLLVKELGIKCPNCGSSNWTPARFFNLMFSTKAGTTKDAQYEIYLRPETAQGIYVNFLNVWKTSRKKIPFGVAQIGKAFRNEIVFGDFLIRMREFEQMEMQYFIHPSTEKKFYDYWLNERLKWYYAFNIPSDAINVKKHERLAHYASMAHDIEIKISEKFYEVEGIHSRTNYDLKNHAELSKKNLEYVDSTTGEKFIPYIIETSAGLDRIFLGLLWHNYYLQEVPSQKESGKDIREVLGIPPPLAPYKCAVFPLVKKEPLREISLKIFNDLKKFFPSFYEEKDTIGQRYRRQDAIGTPFCITIDFQTPEDETVTIRYRDTLAQIRIKISEIHNFLQKNCHISTLLEPLK